MKRIDEETRRLMGQESAGKTLLSFALAAVYGAAAALAAMVGREMAIAIASGRIMVAELGAAQYGGVANVAEIVATVAAVALWLITFVVAWTHMEKGGDLKTRLGRCAVWTLCALALGLIFALVQLIATGNWPHLS